MEIMFNSGREEILEFLEDKPKVKCICLYSYPDEKCYSTPTEPILKIGFTEQDFENFLAEVEESWCYTDGIIWFEDNTWAEIETYDDRTWWEHRKLPDIPEVCNGNNS